jgi:NAD(P) transhydrogenase subunit alpha
MDVLSSMATVAGYKAVLEAAARLPRIVPMMITAGGTIPPARVFVVGVGVAGLQAIATAKRLGAVVRAYDVRPAAKEQVESLGAKFVELPLVADSAEATGGYAKEMDRSFQQRQRQLLLPVVADSDIVITSAAVPGKPAPVLITEDMVREMRPGSVIVDLAADSGGNCQLTRPGETITAHLVTILGPNNLPSAIPAHASLLFANNISAFVLNMVKEGKLSLNPDDPIVQETLVAHEGEVVEPRVREALGLSELPEKIEEARAG